MINIFKMASGIIETGMNLGRQTPDGRKVYVSVDLIGIQDEAKNQIYSKLMSLGYREFGYYRNKKFTKEVNLSNIQKVRDELDSLSQYNVSISHQNGLDKIKEYLTKEQEEKQEEPVKEPEVKEPEVDKKEEPSVEGDAKESSPEKIKELRTKFKGAIWSGKNPYEKSKNVSEIVSETMKVLATQTASVLKEGGIADYLFAKTLNKRSWYNQILAWIQKPDANLMKGATQWLDNGRYVPGYKYKQADVSKMSALGLSIPNIKSPLEDKTKNGIIQCLPKIQSGDVVMNPYGFNALTGAIKQSLNKSGNLQWSGKDANYNKFISDITGTLSTYRLKNNYINKITEIINNNHLSSSLEVVRYIDSDKGSFFGKAQRFEFKASLFDISDTEIIPGWEEKTGKKPVEPIKREDWMGRNIGDLEKAEVIMDALKEFATSKKIPVEFKDTGHAGGYADPQGVKIDKKSGHATRLGTMVHELTHKMLHFEGEKLNKIRHDITREDAETDAESAAYIIRTKLGYETENAKVYIAVHNAYRFEDIKKLESHIADRAKVIDKVIKEITDFIDDYFKNTGNERFVEASVKIKNIFKL